MICMKNTKRIAEGHVMQNLFLIKSLANGRCGQIKDFLALSILLGKSLTFSGT
jgi:hypothetical protein